MTEKTAEPTTRNTRQTTSGAVPEVERISDVEWNDSAAGKVRSTAGRNVRRPYSSSTKFADEKVAHGDVHAALQEQLQDDRYADMRGDLGAQYLESLPIQSFGDATVPGFKLITKALADELGLAGVGEEGEDTEWEDVPLDQPTQEEAAAVDGNLIHTFVDGIRGQHLFDVLNATLLAQVAANFRFDRANQPVEWTKFYGNVLENIGFVVPQFDFRSLRSQATRFSLDSAVIKLLTSILSGEQVDLVKNALEALQALNSEDRRLQIWRRSSANVPNAGTFQVTGVGESAAGILQMGLSGIHFQTDESVTDVLWFRFNSGSTNIEAVKTTLVLNDQVYNRLRDAVIEKLGNRGLKFIARLELGDEVS
jgi:hypothetical protein